MTVELIQFYGETASEKNKFFSFKINSIFDLESSLKRFMRSYYIRSAWYVCKEDGKIVNNDRIDMTQFVDFNTIHFNSSRPPYSIPAIS